MRKVDRLKKLHAPIDDKYKKIDTTVNGDVERLAEMHKEVEKELYPLRIDHRTVIYVTKDKCTPEYAAKKAQDVGACPCCRSKRIRIKTCGHGQAAEDGKRRDEVQGHCL